MVNDTLSQHKMVSSWNLDKWKHQVISFKTFSNQKTRCKLIVLGEKRRLRHDFILWCFSLKDKIT